MTKYTIVYCLVAARTEFLTVQWWSNEHSYLMVYRRVQEPGALHWRMRAAAWRTALAL